MFTKTFKEISKKDAATAGGKGASLGEMTGAGIPVPGGFVVLAPAFERFLEETDLDVEIDSILHTVKHEEMHTVEHASEKIQALILDANMPKDIGAEVEKEFATLDAKFVAVRSSATAEDSASAAWAGQLDSFLNTTEKELLKNVQRCWASLFTPRAIFYRFEKGLHQQKISVAVVVQKMVESEVSGIAFSVHPVTEDYNQLIIEAGFGLGEAIVSGQVTPDSYVVEKQPRRIIDTNISEQDRGIFRSSDSPFPKGSTRKGEGILPLQKGVPPSSAGRDFSKSSGLADSATSFKKGGAKEEPNEWVSIPPEKASRQKLSDADILKFTDIVLGIEKHYGFPCDIEWALEKGKFYILQSRPITTLSKKSAPKSGLEQLPYVPGLLMKKLTDWRGKEWYHQRFDGSPYFMHFISEAEILYDEEKKRGGDFSVHYSFYDDGKADWYIAQEDIRHVAKSVIEAGKDDPDISKTLMKAWDGAETAFYNICKEVADTELRKLSNGELETLHDRFLDAVLRRNSSSSVIDGFALGTDELLA